jgi:hypothetical protein
MRHHSLDDVACPLTCQVVVVHCGPSFVVGYHIADGDVAPCFLCEKKRVGEGEVMVLTSTLPVVHEHCTSLLSVAAFHVRK